jgi:AraC-like DNA-binding protein
MPKEFGPGVRPLVSQESPRIIWRSFEYYPPLKRLLEYVSDHPSETLSLGQAAEIASFEYTHFATYFRNKTGVTFKSWIDFIRIWRAAQMLDSAEKSITEVAHDSGFGDGTTFCRTFRRVMGMTPIQYRKRQRPDAARQLVHHNSKESPENSKELPKKSKEWPRL